PSVSAGASLSRGGRWTKRSGDRRRGVGGVEERTRTSTGLPPPDPESGVSTNSTTSARRRQSARHVLDAMMQVKAIAGILRGLVDAGVGYETDVRSFRTDRAQAQNPRRRR